MLLDYYGFQEEPFGVTPDPRCIYPSATHSEALASIKYSFLSKRGFIALIAPPGMGKTTILFRFLEEVKGTARSVFLFDVGPSCEPDDIISLILRDLGVVPGADRATMHDQLNAVLLAEAKADSSLVLVIDEAQNLSDEALETVRVLTNFETSRSKLMQVVLSGQPQLSEKLMKPSLAQLRQRISTICHVDRLSPQQTRGYIEHRLKFAGYKGPTLFHPEAVRRIVDASEGVPRVVNTLCFNSLSLCFALQRKQVTRKMVAEVLGDQRFIRRRTWTMRLDWSKGLTVAALLGISLIGGLKLGQSARRGEQAGRQGEPSHEPKGAVLEKLKAVTPANVAKQQESVKPFSIVVKPDETLEQIGVRYLGKFDRTATDEILKLNPDLPDADHIIAGQTIWLPASAEAAGKLDSPVH